MKRPIINKQIAVALKQEELGIPIQDVIRQAGITEDTFLSWKKQYGALPGFTHEMRCLREENARLKEIVADLSLQNAQLRELRENGSQEEN
ncbi:transposase [uncultured Oxalicibacterium sp.]|uniref:transposase n=1 Tax=uncultured Oxalicibacterium sp. TaxID=1168540 RepID=UPI0026008945|nr:transposase [uncultured Oxalicibacterium sp.]